MLLVDPRAGSEQLIQPMKARGLPVEVQQLEFGDVAFIGNGEQGPNTVAVAVEYKKTGDVIKCMTDGRFAGHQLVGLTTTYDEYWLLIEGILRPSSQTGSLQYLTLRGSWRDAQQGSRLIMYRDFQHWLLSMTMMAGLKVATTSNLPHSVAWLHALYSWWTAKEWKEHKSHVAINKSGAIGVGSGIGSHAVLSRPSLARRVALQLPGVGFEKSAAVATALPTILDIALAEENEWQEITGVGKGMAKKIHAAIRGENG